MPQYGFSLARIFPYKGRIFDSVLIQEKDWSEKTRDIKVQDSDIKVQDSDINVQDNWKKLVIKYHIAPCLR